jgi:AcrR family transcriptional regulator
MDHRSRTGARRRSQMLDRIVSAARPVFAAMGPDAAVIDDFIRAAGVSRGTFYNYFRTTGELLQATSQRLTDELVDLIDARITRVPAADARLATALRLVGRKALTDRDWCAFVARASHVGVHSRHHLLRDLRLGLRNGAFKLPGVSAAFDLASGAMMQTIRSIDAGSCRSPRELDQRLRLLLRALGVPPSRIAHLMEFPLPLLPDAADGAHAVRLRGAPAAAPRRVRTASP